MNHSKRQSLRGLLRIKRGRQGRHPCTHREALFAHVAPEQLHVHPPVGLGREARPTPRKSHEATLVFRAHGLNHLQPSATDMEREHTDQGNCTAADLHTCEHRYRNVGDTRASCGGSWVCARNIHKQRRTSRARALGVPTKAADVLTASAGRAKQASMSMQLKLSTTACVNVQPPRSAHLQV